MNLEKKWKNFVEKIFAKSLTNSRFPLSKKKIMHPFFETRIYDQFLIDVII